MSFKVNDRVEVRSGAGADFNLGVDVDIVRGQIVARHEPRIEAGTYGLFFRADDGHADRDLYPLYTDEVTGVQYDWSFTGDGKFVTDADEPSVFYIPE